MSLRPGDPREGARGDDGQRLPRCSTTWCRVSTAVRVPARYADDRERSGSRHWRRSASARSTAAIKGASATVAAGALILLEAIAVPIPINQNSTGHTQSGLAPLPASLAVGSAARRGLSLRRAAAGVGRSSSSLPLGEPAFDVRYMFYSDAALEAARQRLQRRRTASVLRAC